MSQASLWLGYLEIGDKSSPVARDPKLCTGKADTIYLFNLQRNQFVEYKSAIVEPKLRELTKDEGEISKDLKKAFNKALKDFSPRGNKASASTESAPVKAAPTKKQKEEEFADVDMGDDDDVFGGDMDDDED